MAGQHADVAALDTSTRSKHEIAGSHILTNGHYVLAADGRFLMIRRETDLTPTELKVVLNFDEELKRLVPTGR